MKHLQGKTIWLIPEDNCVIRNKPLREQLQSAKLVKVARVNVVIQKEDRREQTLRINEARARPTLVVPNYNGSYMVFETEQEAIDILDAWKIAGEITSRFRFSKCFENVPIENLRKVAELLGLNDKGE